MQPNLHSSYGFGYKSGILLFLLLVNFLLFPFKTHAWSKDSSFSLVELLSFEALSEFEYVLLEWQTAKNQDTEYFGVERSLDNQDWQEIGRVEAVENVDINMDYSFLDKQPETGKVFYRLREVDIHGSFSYSKVIEISRESPISVFPNPMSDILYLPLSSGDWKGELFDSQGRRISSYEKVEDSIDLSEFPDGTYILRLKESQGEVQNFSVTKK